MAPNITEAKALPPPSSQKNLLWPPKDGEEAISVRLIKMLTISYTELQPTSPAPLAILPVQNVSATKELPLLATAHTLNMKS